MTYSPDSRIAYPHSYHPKTSLELFLVSNEPQGMPESLKEKDVYVATPRTLLTQYADSHLGKWHSEQPPRYPNFHRDMPASVMPEYATDDLPFQQNFGRAWLKNFVFLGDLSVIEEDNHETTEERFPYTDVADVIDPSDTQASDLHPVGHMVRTSVVLHETLHIGTGTDHDLSAYARYITTSAMALHDSGENEHPGIIIETGSVVGDISAATGKTQDNRDQERKILESILSKEFADYFDDEMVELMSHLIGHRTSELSGEFLTAHSIQEIAHNLNSLRTGVYAANVGIWCAQTLARKHDRGHEAISIVGHSMAMAEQHIKILSKKFDEIKEDTPDVYAFYDDAVIHSQMAHLYQKSHALDNNEHFISWRNQDAIAEQYGKYTPIN